MGTLAGPAENRNIFEFLAAEAGGLVREKLAGAFRGEIQRFEIPFSRDDGTHGVGAVLYAPIREGSGVTRVLILARDVTEQKRNESQFQQAEKLAAMGQLVSGVAHEINNPAAIISGFAQTLLLDDLKPEHREMLQMMYDEATRIGRITSNLLAFARAGSKQRALVDLNDIARRTFALRSYHLSTLNIAVSFDLDPSEPKIWADASELQQLILNLLINAEQALLTIDGPRTIVVRTRADEGEARLEIADSGPGIRAEIQSKIFDPFFTTKPEGVGTGLGLSICYGIAREHGGRIWVESELGHGARFGVTLPRDPREESRPQPQAAPHTAPAAGELTVLVVDDEAALRNALLRFLDRRGIHGEGVSDGAEALRALQQRRFDVIISDVRMPGMSGRELLERLERDQTVRFRDARARDPGGCRAVRERNRGPQCKRRFQTLTSWPCVKISYRNVAGCKPTRKPFGNRKLQVRLLTALSRQLSNAEFLPEGQGHEHEGVLDPQVRRGATPLVRRSGTRRRGTNERRTARRRSPPSRRSPPARRSVGTGVLRARRSVGSRRSTPERRSSSWRRSPRVRRSGSGS